MPSSGADQRAARDRHRRLLEVVAARHQAADLVGEHLALLLLLEVGHDLGDGEHADGDGDEADAVKQLRHAEREALRARVHVDADKAEDQPDDHHADAFRTEPMRDHHRADKPEHHQREILGRTEPRRNGRQRRRQQAQISVATVPATNEAMAAIASAGPARPCRAIW